MRPFFRNTSPRLKHARGVGLPLVLARQLRLLSFQSAHPAWLCRGSVHFLGRLSTVRPMATGLEQLRNPASPSLLSTWLSCRYTSAELMCRVAPLPQPGAVKEAGPSNLHSAATCSTLLALLPQGKMERCASGVSEWWMVISALFTIKEAPSCNKGSAH